MPIHRNLEGLLQGLAGERRIRPGLLALDVSKRAIGVAGADPTWSLATPLAVIRRRGWTADLEALRRVIEARGAGALIVGWPLNMDGSEGPRCQSVRAFAEHVEHDLGLPVVLFDERLSTFAAEEAAERAGLRGRKREAMIDALAAAAILEDALRALGRDCNGRG